MPVPLLVALVLAFPAAGPGPLAGQDAWAFETRSLFDPLLAEVRAPQVSVLVPARSGSFAFAPEEGPFWAWDVSLGAEIPLVGWESASTRLGDRIPGAFGVGLWLPVSFHMIEDIEHAEHSRPILNTDYRFGLALKGGWQRWERTALEARLTVAHESTHLGDEYALLAAERAPDRFRRINVSYEAVEYGIGIQHRRRLPFWGASEILVRHTGSLPWSPSFYGERIQEGPGERVTPSHRSFEPGIGVQLLPEAAWRPGFSVEARRRIVYGYDRPYAEVPEATRWSWNLIVASRTRTLDFARAVDFLLYGRFYAGVNPAGQFRDDPSWRIWGVGILMRVGAR